MNKMEGIRRRSWAEIDLNAVQHNYNAVRSAVDQSVKVCCVVKADAYGHGAVMLARLYERLGADFLAVSNIEEGIQLRRAGISLPILILGFTPEECAEELASYRLSQCVYSYPYGMKLAQCAERAGVKLHIHIKLDTGMGRIGFACHASELDKAKEVCTLPCFETEGIFTHFAVADGGDEGDAYTAEQGERFTFGVSYLEQQGIRFPIRHCANSAAIFDHPELHLDMVRAGIVLYGFAPSEQVRHLPKLLPVMTLKTVISHIKTIEKGQTLSYGRTFEADRTLRVATLPIGYADGFSRRLGQGRYALSWQGTSLPILGRVCMDQLMVNVTDVACQPGDEITVFGAEGNATAEEIARINDTISYEVTCDIAKRVPRIFLEDGEIVGQMDLIVAEG